MFKFVVFACAVAAAAAEADPAVAYAAGLPYGGAYTGYAGLPVAGYAGYAGLPVTGYNGYALGHAAGVYGAGVYAAGVPALTPAPLAAVAPAPVAAVAPTPVAAAAYALPAARTIHEAPIVEQYVEPVEQWGYKVAY